jgi:hypothetical protein
LSSQSKLVLQTVVHVQALHTVQNAMMVTCFLQESAINALLAVHNVQVISTPALSAFMVIIFLQEDAILALILTAPYVQIMSVPALSVLMVTRFM